MKISPTCLADDGVLRIFDAFERIEPGSIRVVGGTVRDAIMERPINDVDFATVLTPEVVTRVCERAGFDVIPTGIDHGTVTAIWNHEPYEITTLRRDVETDGRRAVVAFSTDWAEDAYRRDFRFNALYLGADGTVYDYSPDEGGIADAKARRISFMGDAHERCREDYLRILRMFRFQSALVGHFDEDAEAAVRNLASGIAGLSGERIEKEIIKLLAGPAADVALTEMAHTGVFAHVFGFAPDIEAITARLDRLGDLPGRLAPLAAVIGWDWPSAERLLNRWKSSTSLRTAVGEVIRGGPFPLKRTDDEVRAALFRSGKPFVVRQQIAMTYASGTDVPAERVREMLDIVVPSFPVQGQDVLDLGVKPGKQVGAILTAVANRWIAAGFPGEDDVRMMLKREVNGAA